MDNYNRTYYSSSKIKFGKHKGKTIKEVYCGIKSISQSDAAKIYSVFSNSKITSSKSLHIIHGIIKDSTAESIIPIGQKKLIYYLPDPDYLNWCILNIKGFIIPLDELDKLEKEYIHTLIKIEKTENTYTPIFESSQRTFPYQIREKCKQKWGFSHSTLDEENDDEYFDDYTDYEDQDFEDMYCPACQERKPCGCNYSIENYT